MKKLLNLVLIAVFSLIIFSIEIMAENNKGSEIMGMVSFVKGKVMIKKAGSQKWDSLKLRTKVTKNDVIKTFKKASVLIRFKNQSIAKIKPERTVKVALLLKKPVKVTGTLKTVFSKISKGGKRNLGITAVVGVRGDDVSRKEIKVKPDELLWEE